MGGRKKINSHFKEVKRKSRRTNNKNVGFNGKPVCVVGPNAPAAVKAQVLKIPRPTARRPA